MLTHEIEARKRLHDHAMEESDRRRSRVQVEKPTHRSRTYVRTERMYIRALEQCKVFFFFFFFYRGII